MFLDYLRENDLFLGDLLINIDFHAIIYTFGYLLLKVVIA